MPNHDIIIELQVQWLVRRLGLTPDRARILAGLAFQQGGRT